MFRVTDPVANRHARSNSVLLTEHVLATLGGDKQRRVVTFSAPPVSTLEDMSELDILMLEFGYGCPVILDGTKR